MTSNTAGAESGWSHPVIDPGSAPRAWSSSPTESREGREHREPRRGQRSQPKSGEGCGEPRGEPWSSRRLLDSRSEYAAKSEDFNYVSQERRAPNVFQSIDNPLTKEPMLAPLGALSRRTVPVYA